MESPLAPHVASPAELKERIQAERRGKPFLIWRDGEGRQQILALEADAGHITVGRRSLNDIALEWDSEVSRLHAEFERLAGEWTISDDGLSANGSYVNGERLVRRRRLRDGDALRFGSTVVAFRAPGRAGSHATEVVEELSDVLQITEAQRRVLVGLCEPFTGQTRFARPASNQEIADQLHISVDAVKTHMRRLYDLFGLAHLPQREKRLRLVERAFELGVVSPGDSD
jgi:FHA domain/Bacterial regulatory proteins, luxR family